MVDTQAQLGRLLVERGSLSEEQLAYALDEQTRTGFSLGQVLIGLSYVTASTIAQALAAPHGNVAKTEHAVAAPPSAPQQDLSARIAQLELDVASARQAEQVARQAEQVARKQLAAAQTSGDALGAAAVRIAEVEASYVEMRRQLLSSMERSEQLERELSEVRQGAVGELQRTQHELAVTTENLRAAYARLHDYELTQAFRQQQPHEPARTASPFAWQA